ncbi:MAG TPA: DUF2071 domain-containing protein, partial [Puia sp.]|nr:DUF2071 domain-containing protein [Puia sp.]
MDNTPTSVFLKAEWRKLIIANYTVEPGKLMKYLPAKTELDQYEGSVYVSLVGFMFRKVRVKGILIPFHTIFPEVNLRFYVRFKEKGEWKRGVVFISEIVPRPAITLVANTLFNEHYISLPMRQTEEIAGGNLQVGYGWRYQRKWNELYVEANIYAQPLLSGSKEEFITEHFWG